MKTRFLMVIGLMVLAVAAAQAQPNLIQTQVPFSFRAGNDVLPAGQYRISLDSANIVRMVSIDGAPALYLWLTTRERTASASDSGRLVFHRYGNQYFLHEVWAPGQTRGYEVPRSKAEREIARRAGGAEIASLTLR